MAHGINMKILSRTDSEMVLKDGNVLSIVVGIVAVVVGVVIYVDFLSLNAWMIWFALGAVILGLLMTFLSSSIGVDINKNDQTFSYRKKRLIGGSVSTYAIADVFRIETRKQWEMRSASTNARGPVAQYPTLVSQSIIVLKDGRELALDHSKSSSSMHIGNAVNMVSQGNETALATQVADFMGVPFQEVAPPNIGATIGGPGGIQL
jgi:hypothetical protein